MSPSESSLSSVRCLTGLIESGIKLALFLLLLHCCEHYKTANAQTEGDTGYDYGDLDDNDYYDESAVSRNPVFDIPMANVTVVEGQTALLPCSIEHLGKYKVAWLERGSFPLTLEEKRVTDDGRFAVVRPQAKEWNLQITDVRSTDAGQYRCTVNNQLVLSKIVTLSVKVPAKINQSTAGGALTIGEGEALTMECNATGTPKPQVTWRRTQTKDSSNCTAFRPGIVLHTGRKFVIRNISRNCGDTYECTADNGVRAPATRSFAVRVEFAPRIVLPNRRLGQVPGRDTILECRITARPQVSNYWAKGGPEGHPVHSHSTRHSVDIFEDGGPDSVILSLRINEINHDDYGDYQCIAINPHGRDEKTMTLFEYKEPGKQEDQQSRSGATSYDYFGGNISKDTFTGAKMGHALNSRGSRSSEDLVGRWLRVLLLTSAAFEIQWLCGVDGNSARSHGYSPHPL